MAQAKNIEANEEFAKADVLKKDMEESELIAQSKKDEALSDEALAALDEDAAAEYYAASARDEAIGSEEEASSLLEQSQAGELFEASTGKVFSANEVRLDAESKEQKAEQTMKRSLSHGAHAFGFAIQSLLTAGLVIYVSVMRFLFHVTFPAIKRTLKSESQCSHLEIGEKLLLMTMHFSVLTGTIALLVGRRSSTDIAIASKWRDLILLASIAGLIESVAIHSLFEACRCYMTGKDATSTTIAIFKSFLSNATYLVPVLMIECLILVVVFGPRVFEQIYNILRGGNQILIWFGLVVMFSLRLYKFQRMSSTFKPDRTTTKHKNQIENGEEGYFVGDDKCRGLSALNEDEYHTEYGTMEEIPLIDPPNSSEANAEKISTSAEKETGYYQMFCQYCKSLQLYLDLLVCALMVMLFYHFCPLLKVLQPIAKSFLGVAASLHIVSLLIVVLIILFLIVHYKFVR